MKITVPLTFLAYLSILAWFGHLTSFSQESVPWRRSEGVREPHKDRRCKYSILRGCWPPPGALGTVVICAALRPSQIPTLPEGFS